MVSTENKQPRAFLPVQWSKSGFSAGQSTGIAMAITGFPSGINEFTLLRDTSLVTVGILLSSPVTAGFIRFEVVKNGSATGKTVDVNSGSGLAAMWEIKPGTMRGTKGDRIGVQWGSSATLAPSGTIDGVIFFEVQDG
jgi:hypothetical protein